MSGLHRAIAFLTPLGRSTAPDDRTLRWFPAVGAAIGATVGGVWWAAAEVWPPAVVAAIVVAADLALTGLLHIDGLVDSADGLLPPLERNRRLEVMADPSAGAFGVVTATSVLLGRFAAIATLRPSVALVAALWCTSRTAMVLAIRVLPYARPTGLATAFHGASGAWAAIGTGVAAGATLGIAGAQGSGLAAVAGCWAAAGVVLLLAHRRIGGYTGDVLGAVAVVGETVGLMLAATRW